VTKGRGLLERKQYDEFRVSPLDPAALRNRDVERIVKKLAVSSARRLNVEKFDESNEGRPIYLATLGKGPQRVLLWSQMHGDEPTHTAVMLDVFSYLLQRPAKPKAEEILSGCMLMFIPMLNPDGAEAVIRFNAQGIDINRDWRRLATPEGRALQRAAKTLNPQFGFNLHNQNARTSVGRPPRPAAVSVLAPPPDASRTESPSMRTAKQMCTCFVEAVRPYAEGMISRYDDTYEPRAFGDGIQSLGVATMLVEAGGWPQADPEPLTRLHFHGMLATLHAIATDKLREADHQVYEDLPKSNSLRLNDCVITKANVLDAKVAKPFMADIVIDQTNSERLAVTSNRDGNIVDIGDLPSVSARLTINRSNSLLVPGQFTYVRDWNPGTAFDERRIAQLLTHGTTTVLGVVDLTDRDAIEATTKPQSLPFNWAFVGNADSLGRMKSGEVVERIAIAAASGVVGVVSEGTNEELWKVIHRFDLPLFKTSQLPEKPASSYLDAAKQTWSTATALKQQSRRGRINREYFADLLFFNEVDGQKVGEAIDWKKLTRVMVAGETVWENGTRVGGTPGVLLRRT
jgi:Zinc carboxypeptidase